MAELPISDTQRSRTRGTHQPGALAQPLLLVWLQGWHSSGQSPRPSLCNARAMPPVQGGGKGQGRGLTRRVTLQGKHRVAGGSSGFVVIVARPCVLLANPVIYYLCGS